jgi:serine/threonine protein kinase
MPRTISHYEVFEKLGEGGMGVVWKARDIRLDRIVALKLLPAEKTGDPERKRRFVQEAKSASALNHPNIVTIYDVDCVDRIDFIAMEYIDGDTLDHRIGSHPMRLSAALKYALQIADALARAHGAGIVHRDVKPGNIMIDKHDQVKVLDFGLAKLTEVIPDERQSTVTIESQTEEGTVVGTVAYMSPEQAEGKPVDARSDIFSFGSLLYEMATGIRPFRGETRMSTISAILSKNPEPLSARVPGIPHELERIISRCLRKDPDRRFQQMAEVNLALEDLKEESESAATSRHPLATKPGHRRIIWPATVLTAVLALGAGVLCLRKPAPQSGQAPMTRLTSDSGWNTDPALSSDGKLLAYASDRATGENLDIWVQHMGGGDAVRLTNWDSDEMEPDFSPDGSRIVFRSNRQGGGIYVVPVLGGEPTLVAPKGFRPKFSPDGNWIAYWFGTEGSTLLFAQSQVFVVPSKGGLPKRVAVDLANASYPIWSPDSKRLMVTGVRERSFDFWIVPLDGSPSKHTEMVQVLDRVHLRRGTIVSPRATGTPALWTHDGQWIVFSGGTGDTSDLYRVALASSGKITADPQRITFGTGITSEPALSADGQLAFANEVFTSHLWSVSADTNAGKLLGPMTAISTETTVDKWPRISPDGKQLTYLSQTTGRTKLFLRNLASGAKRELAPGWFFGWDYGAPLSSAGSKVLFTGAPSPDVDVGIYLLDLNSGVPLLLKNKSGIACVSEDGRFIVMWPVPPGAQTSRSGTSVVNVETREESPLTSETMLSPQFSWDGQWLTFHVVNSENSRQIYVTPFREGRPTPRSEWVAVTDGKRLDRNPQWSPDGNLLYFMADRDGARGIYAQRLDPVTKHPVGALFEVEMFRSARRSMMQFANSGESWPAVARDKIVFPLGEMTGNIWLTRLP